MQSATLVRFWLCSFAMRTHASVGRGSCWGGTANSPVFCWSPDLLPTTTPPYTMAETADAQVPPRREDVQCRTARGALVRSSPSFAGTASAAAGFPSCVHPATMATAAATWVPPLGAVARRGDNGASRSGTAVATITVTHHSPLSSPFLPSPGRAPLREGCCAGFQAVSCVAVARAAHHHHTTTVGHPPYRLRPATPSPHHPNCPSHHSNPPSLAVVCAPSTATLL